MKKVMCFFVLLSSIFVNKNVNGVENQYINKSYIVMNALNNEMVEGKDVHLIRSVASVSKIMSAIVAIESGTLDQEIVILKEDIDTYGSSIYLKEGNKITIRDLVYGLLLRSGNDAAKAIARSVSGSVENFAIEMNKKAMEIGMKNSSFNNPSGLDVNEVGNLSTSYDLALLMSYAIKNEEFVKISSTKEYKSEIGTWSNKNKLLKSYNKTIAGKTGFTYKAKRTLVTAARDNDTTFVVVSLDCGNDFNFHKYLYEKNFKEYQSVKVLSQGENFLENYKIICENDIYLTVQKENVDNYSLIHHLDSQKSTVYVSNNGDKKRIGECNVEKVDSDSKKSQNRLWKKFVKLFK